LYKGATLPRIHFQQQLAALKDKLLAMAALSQQAVISAADAYLQRDAGLCQYVRENETAINAAQREVDEMAYELLAQEQPMAIDLRFILAVIKIRTQELLDYPAVELPVDIASMSEHASRMIRLAIQALLDADAQFADAVVTMDDEIDHMNRLARSELMKVMEEQSEISLQALNAIIIARALERIADHATNIARDVIFWIRGADVRHQVSSAID
jgi:phosphate transport system protein